MKEETPEQAAARRAADAKRKRDERARKKEAQVAAASQEELNAAKSFPEYWERNHANLTPELRAQYEQREESILDLQHCMRLYVEDRYQFESEDTHVTLDEAKQAVAEEIAAHGLCESIILVVDRLWTDEEKDLRERIIRKGGAIATLLQYGYRTALDGFLYERFYQKFLRPRSKAVQHFTTLTCMCGQTTSISVEVARLYTARLYRCQRCLDREASSRAAAMKSLAAEYRTPENTLYDDWGRIKDQ